MAEHPIIPPPELVQQWDNECVTADMPDQVYIATQAARWGADRELEACFEWLTSNQNPRWAIALLEGRRPKPSSLKELALKALEEEDDSMPLRSLQRGERFDIIRRALEQLND